ncbi:MAG: DUF2059 domain-containing protein [Paludibacter sp.]|nr:DUF2059 domain-containing protein [Paludibacter sp.]
MKKTIAFLVLSLVMSSAGFAQTNDEYGIALKKMFMVSGSNETYKVAIKQMISMYKTESSLSPEKLKNLEDEMMKTSMKELTDLLIPIYQKYITISDINEMIKFYESPVGKKFANNNPAITQESMKIGQQWGMKIAGQIQNKLK